MTKKNINITGLIVAFLAIIALLILLYKNKKLRDEVKEKNNIVTALNDTLKITRNKDSSTTATITSFQISRAEDLLKLKTSDSTVVRLQHLLAEEKKSIGSRGIAAVFTNTASINTTMPSIVTSKDTVVKDSVRYLYPTYTGNIDWEFVNAVVTANRDSINLKLKVVDKVDLTIGYDKDKPIIKLKNYNPDVITTELRSVIFSKPPQKRIGLGGTIGYGATFIDKQVRTGISGSIGLTYTIIPIK